MFLIHTTAIVDQWLFLMPTPDGRPDIHAEPVPMDGSIFFPTRREAVKAAESHGLAVRGHHVVTAGWHTPIDHMYDGTPGTPRCSDRPYHAPAADAEPLTLPTGTEMGGILAAVDRELTGTASWRTDTIPMDQPRWRVGSYGYVDAGTWNATFLDKPAWTRDAYMCVRNGIPAATIATQLRKDPDGFHQWARHMFYSGWDGAVWAEPDGRPRHL